MTNTVEKILRSQRAQVAPPQATGLGPAPGAEAKPEATGVRDDALLRPTPATSCQMAASEFLIDPSGWRRPVSEQFVVARWRWWR